MPRAAGVGAGTILLRRLARRAGQEAVLRGSLARADATPFAGQHVVAAWGIDLGWVQSGSAHSARRFRFCQQWHLRGLARTEPASRKHRSRARRIY
jgi:hypothetical protein